MAAVLCGELCSAPSSATPGHGCVSEGSGSVGIAALGAGALVVGDFAERAGKVGTAAPNACACSLSQYSDENMMDPYNLAICFGPTLMHIPDGQDPVSCQAHVNEVIKTIIINHEGIFPSHRELEGPVYEKCMTGGEEYW